MKLFVVNGDTYKGGYGVEATVFAVCDNIEKANEIKNHLQTTKGYFVCVNEINLNELNPILVMDYYE